MKSASPSIGSAVVFGPEELYIDRDLQKLYMSVADGYSLDKLTEEFKKFLLERNITNITVLEPKEISTFDNFADPGVINRFRDILYGENLRATLEGDPNLFEITPDQMNGIPREDKKSKLYAWSWNVRPKEGSESIDKPTLRLTIWIDNSKTPSEQLDRRTMQIEMKVQVSKNWSTRFISSLDGTAKTLTSLFSNLNAVLTSLAALLATVILWTARGRAAGRYLFGLFRSR